VSGPCRVRVVEFSYKRINLHCSDTLVAVNIDADVERSTLVVELVDKCVDVDFTAMNTHTHMHTRLIDLTSLVLVIGKPATEYHADLLAGKFMSNLTQNESFR